LSAYPNLFKPLDIGGVTVRNRIAHAAIVTRFVNNGEATDRMINYHSNRARGGAGMIVTEPVAMIGLNKDPGRLRAYDDLGMQSLKRLAEAVEQHDCRLLGQVQDPGRGRHEVGRNDAAIGVSALPDDLSWTVPHVLSTADIERMIEEWSIACRRLRDAGFSGVELSAGHGHLFHQFLSPWSNRRDDAYGGDLDGRTRFLRELIGAIRTECGRPFIVGTKLPGPDGVVNSIDKGEAAAIAGMIAATGEVDFWTFAWGAHANSLWTHLPGAHNPRAPYLHDIAELSATDRTIASGALGYISDPNEAERAVSEGLCDFVFLGRPLITDPAWPEKARTGRETEIRYCVSCNSCWRSIIDGQRLECDNNPRIAEPDEALWQPAIAAHKKRVVVIGSGVAGMEAAWVAAARGHEVTLFGASAEPGGKTRLAARLPGGANLSSVYDYQYLAGKRHGVTYEFGVRAELELVRDAQPDQVLLACGSRMNLPAFVPSEMAEAGLIQDLRSFIVPFLGMKKKKSESGRLVLFDCDHTEMTYAAAELLADIFAKVTIVTPRERIATDCSLVNRQQIYQRLYDRQVEILTSLMPVSLDNLEDAQLRVSNVYNADEQLLDGIAAITYATARAPSDELRSPLAAEGFDVVTIGDCHAPRSLLAATRQGYQVGNSL
jgi:2,4-dienoyl-CoA reductase-like NADH-dependent reductase (Old Yellow Enzyme family)